MATTTTPVSDQADVVAQTVVAVHDHLGRVGAKLDLLARHGHADVHELVVEWNELEAAAGRTIRKRTFTRGKVARAERAIARAAEGGTPVKPPAGPTVASVRKAL